MSLDVSLTCTCCNTNVFDSNITHNLGKMADEAGIYEHLWRPDEIGITHAKDLIEPLELGLIKLMSDRGKFEKFDAPNGWGTYDNFVAFVTSYLDACKKYPDCKVYASR